MPRKSSFFGSIARVPPSLLWFIWNIYCTVQYSTVLYCTAEFRSTCLPFPSAEARTCKTRSVFKRPVSRASPHLPPISLPWHSCLIAPRDPYGLMNRRHWYSPSCSTAIVAVVIWIRKRRELGKARGMEFRGKESAVNSRTVDTSYRFFFSS